MLAKSSIRIDIFSYSISTILEDHLPSYIISTLSNMLALYYSLDKLLRETEPNMPQYADLCSNRVKKFLNGKVIIEENFNTALSLFAIAITPESISSEELSSLNKLRDQEKISEIIGITILGDDISDHELALLADVIDLVFAAPEASDIADFIGANPEIVLKILRGKKRKASEIAEVLTKTAISATKSTSIISGLAQFVGLTACSIMAFVGNFIAVSSFTAIAAAAIIPVSIVALQYGAEFGEKVGTKIASLKRETKAIAIERQDLLRDIMPSVEHDNLQAMNLQHTKSKEIISNIEISQINLKDITKDLSTHVGFASQSTSVVRGTKLTKEGPDSQGRKV